MRAAGYRRFCAPEVVRVVEVPKILPSHDGVLARPGNRTSPTPSRAPDPWRPEPLATRPRARRCWLAEEFGINVNEAFVIRPEGLLLARIDADCAIDPAEILDGVRTGAAEGRVPLEPELRDVEPDATRVEEVEGRCRPARTPPIQHPCASPRWLECHDEGMSIRSFSRPVHRTSLRMAVMAAGGLAVALPIGIFGSWAYAPAMGWAASSLIYLVGVWPLIGRLDASGTAAHAGREDPGRFVSDLLVLGATLGSFGGVALILLEAGSAEGGVKAAIIGVALASVALSWLLVHTLFTLRYATIYYGQNDGVDFNKKNPPRYADFAYLSFTIGMTFQVSDTDLTTDAIRYTALRQALLSYVLGAIVLATMINLVSGLVR
jgi:uncharacterized membrane protein